MILLEDVKEGVNCHRSFRCFERNVRPWLAYRQQMSSVIGLICVCNRIILTDTFEWVEEGENFAPRIDLNGAQSSANWTCSWLQYQTLRNRYI